MENIRAGLAGGLSLRPHAGAAVGTRVRVCNGVFAGAQGVVKELRHPMPCGSVHCERPAVLLAGSTHGRSGAVEGASRKGFAETRAADRLLMLQTQEGPDRNLFDLGPAVLPNYRRRDGSLNAYSVGRSANVEAKPPAPSPEYKFAV
jgi:hypothetical protein